MRRTANIAVRGTRQIYEQSLGHQDIMDIHTLQVSIKTLLKLTFCGKKCLETEIFNNHVDLQRG